MAATKARMSVLETLAENGGRIPLKNFLHTRRATHMRAFVAAMNQWRMLSTFQHCVADVVSFFEDRMKAREEEIQRQEKMNAMREKMKRDAQKREQEREERRTAYSAELKLQHQGGEDDKPQNDTISPSQEMISDSEGRARARASVVDGDGGGGPKTTSRRRRRVWRLHCSGGDGGDTRTRIQKRAIRGAPNSTSLPRSIRYV